MPAATIAAVLSVANAVLSLSRRTSDGGLAAFLAYQSELSKLSLRKLDLLTNEVLNVRNDIQKALSEIDKMIEASRLTEYLDSLQAAHRMFQLAMSTLQDESSSDSEKSKARSDLDECYTIAIAASSSLRSYFGFIPALSIAPSLLLICALISQTERGAAALTSELESHMDWIKVMADPNHPDSMAQITQKALVDFHRAQNSLSKLAIVNVADATVDKKTPITFEKPTVTNQNTFNALIPEKTWEVMVHHGHNTEGDPFHYETKTNPEQKVASRTVYVIAAETIVGDSDLPILSVDVVNKSVATDYDYGHVIVVDNADANLADLTIQNSGLFSEILDERKRGASFADALNTSRALYRIYRAAERSLKSTQKLIHNTQELT